MLVWHSKKPLTYNRKYSILFWLQYSDDHLILINYSVILAKNGVFDKFKTYFKQFEGVYRTLDAETRSQDPEVTQNYELLSNLIRMID